MRIWHAVEIEIARAGESSATSQLWAFGTTGIEISEDSIDFITLRAYFDLSPDIEKMRDQITHSLRQSDLPDAALRRIDRLTVPDQDWLTEWKKGYEPIRVGERLIVSPSWKLDQITDTDRLIIQIDPGMAFGTGTHETTRGCLEMIERYYDGDSLLDVGTGTGILSIAAVKLHPDAHVCAFDIDPEAVAIAEENAVINGVDDKIDVETNNLSGYFDREFDLVVANLTAGAIIPLAKDFAKVVKPDGVLIVSGILSEQAEDVLKALQYANFDMLESRPDGEWVTFALRNKV